MTGAPSKSRNGNYYHYYFCSNVQKHFRCRADEANEKFAQYLSTLKPNKEVLHLYATVFSDLKRNNDTDRKMDADSLNMEIERVKERMYKLEDSFIDGNIEKETFNNMKDRYKKEITTIQEKIDMLVNPNRSNIEPKFKYSINLINNIDSYVRDEKVEVKCKLISSMFPEKIVYDGNSYRTNSYNSVLDLIYQQTNELRGNRNKKGENFNILSSSVPRAGVEPAWK